ncbi:BHLH domain-containing protein [Mycena kentingensis (nom. inval.)]|nr:BHLH domain-containing protein [Mycena kentingensis (nom. inval.)]
MPADRAPPSPTDSEASSSGFSAPPSTPPLSTSLPMPTFMNFTSEDTVNGVPSLKRVPTKPTRRVNSAERRASHNAVERARRETLNGRFLDLAALLPNLHTIRRPSKSAIVNSAIAHLNASRRHRLQAAQQLRLIKDEADALRNELNQWRSRAGVQGLEEPMRAEAFGIVLSGELEFDPADMLEGSEEGDDEEAAYTYNAYRRGSDASVLSAASADVYAMHQAQMLAPIQGAYPGPYAAYPVEPVSPQGYYPSPTIVDHALSAAYENPAMGHAYSYDMKQQWVASAAYDKQQMLHQQQQQQVAGW